MSPKLLAGARTSRSLAPKCNISFILYIYFKEENNDGGVNE